MECPDSPRQDVFDQMDEKSYLRFQILRRTVFEQVAEVDSEKDEYIYVAAVKRETSDKDGVKKARSKHYGHYLSFLSG